MREIWKFPISRLDPVLIGESGQGARGLVSMPASAEVLSVGVQGATICLWAMVDPALAVDQETRQVNVFGTGWPVARDPGKFLGTVQTPPGLVWHVFLAR